MTTFITQYLASYFNPINVLASTLKTIILKKTITLLKSKIL